MIQLLEILCIVAGAVIAAWGLFHQLIVGAAATMFKDMSETEARRVLMRWGAQGAFMSFVGVQTAVLVFFYGLLSHPVQITLLLTSVAMLLLSGHIVLTGYRTHEGPIRTGAIVQLSFGVICLVTALIANPIF